MAIVIDKSGSMRGTRIANALSGAVAAVQQLHDGDSVAVVAFDTRPDVVVPLTQIAAGTRERIIGDIRNIQLGGDTCISCGIEEGLAELRKNRGEVERMLVLSDGDANNGVRDVPGFRSLGERAQSQGVSISTIGVDVDFNEKLMTAVAVASNGRHYFVENDAALAQVFSEEASSLGQSIASGAAVDFDLAPGVELEQVFDRNFTRSGGRISVPLGSFARGEVKTVLMKVRVPKSGDATVPLVDVKLTYRDLGTNEDATAAGKLAVELVDDAKEASELDPVVADRVQRSLTAAALRDANNLFSLGKVEEARKRIQQQRATLDSIAPSATKAAPSTKAKSLDADFRRQDAALDEAEKGFASPPPDTAGAQPSPAPDRQGRAAQKKNEENSFNLGF
jgi:Ca-activated chloride channel family protein